MDCGLEVVLFAQTGDDLTGLLSQIKECVAQEVVRWIVLDTNEKATLPSTTEAVKSALAGAGLPGSVGAGTDHFFTELNRNRGAVEGADFVSFSINPQVHAFDDLSLIETLEMQGVCVNSARSFSEGRPIVVSPLTFKMRSNPNATGVDDDASIDISARTDPRQQQAFGAVWTLGALMYLTGAATHSVTLYEAVGPLGIMSKSGDPYPLFEAIALFSQYKGGSMRPMVSTDPLKTIGFELRSADGDEQSRVLVNLTPRGQVLKFESSVYELEPYSYKVWEA